MYKQAIVNNLIKLAAPRALAGALAGSLAGGISSILHNGYDPRETGPSADDSMYKELDILGPLPEDAFNTRKLQSRIGTAGDTLIGAGATDYVASKLGVKNPMTRAALATGGGALYSALQGANFGSDHRGSDGLALTKALTGMGAGALAGLNAVRLTEPAKQQNSNNRKGVLKSEVHISPDAGEFL